MPRRYRPSAADTWMLCPGQPAYVEAQGIGPTDSEFAAEGRAAHALAARCLLNESFAIDHIGVELEERNEVTKEPYIFEVDEDFAAAVDDYLEAIRRAAHGANDFLVEQTIDMSKILQKEGESGTADVVLLFDKTIEVHDLKFGKGIPVYAKRNRQLLMYAAGVWYKYRKLANVDRIKIVIHQPRIPHIDEAIISVEGIKKFIGLARKAVAKAESAKPGEMLVPGESQCFWCPAKASCPALLQKIEDEVIADFDSMGKLDLPDGSNTDDLEELGRKRQLVDLVTQWASAVSVRVHELLTRGHDVPAWKLAEGRKGRRTWADPVAAAQFLKTSARLTDSAMYDSKLKSPTQLEKVVKPKTWQRLLENGHVKQSPGKPAVVPADSHKAALPSVASEFDDVSGEDLV